MTKALVVASRELRERWLLLAGGLVLGCVPLVLPAFGVEQIVASGVGLVTALLLGLAAALVVGGTMLARDAADGRLAFLFARPSSWRQIWAGKWAAAVVLTIGSGLLAAVPWMLVHRLPTGKSMFSTWDGPAAALVVAWTLIAIGTANLLATFFRARSPRLAVDIVLLLAALWMVARYVAPLFMAGLLAGLGNWMYSLALLPLAAALVVGSASQTAMGRTDIRRAHSALSLGFWLVVWATLLAAAGWVIRIEAKGPADLRSVSFAQLAPDGRWAWLDGELSGAGRYAPDFLVDTSDGRYVALLDLNLWRARDHWWAASTFSPDGRRAVRWIGTESTSLEIADLQASRPRVTRVPLESSLPPSGWTAAALSPSGAAALVVQKSAASLYAIPSGKPLATTAVPPGWHVAAARFRGETARAWLIPARDPWGPGRTDAPPEGPGEARVVDLTADGPARAASFATTAALQPYRGQLVADATGDRLLTLDLGLRLRDGATGSVIATLIEARPVLSARFLADGRVVALERDGTLSAFDAAGGVVQRLSLERPVTTLGPELSPGRIVVVGGAPAPWAWRPMRADSLVVDVEQGRVVERLDGLWPVARDWPLAARLLPAGQGRYHLFSNADGQLVRIDGQTGERRVVAGRGAPRGERIGRL